MGDEYRPGPGRAVGAVPFPDRRPAGPGLLAWISLTTSNCGPAAALHTQPLELGWLREPIRSGLSDVAYPQLILRFGMISQGAVSVRRLPDDVLPTAQSEDPSISHG
jgi:hypothetical protein